MLCLKVQKIGICLDIEEQHIIDLLISDSEIIIRPETELAAAADWIEPECFWQP